MESNAWDPEGIETSLDREGRPTSVDALHGVDARALYKKLVAARCFDLRISSLGLPLWASAAGEEGALVCAGAAMRAGDWLFPSSRDAAALVGRGISLTRIAERVLGLDELPALPGELACIEEQVAPSSESLGLAAAIATGRARAELLAGRKQIVVCTFGEGSTTVGNLHEAMCMAAAAKLPLLFVCKSQLWPEGAPVEAGSLGESVAERAAGLGLWTRRVDGADPISSARAMIRAGALVRGGDGPALVEVVVSPLAHDPPAHRDPVERLRRHLDQAGEWTRTFQDVTEAAARGALDEPIARWEAAS